jgi:diguanylate cyclase (GGDEF)-like protein
MKHSNKSIARRIIFTYASLALVIVFVSTNSILGISYVRQIFIKETRRQQEMALLSAHIRSESLYLTNAVQRYVISSENKSAERDAIDAQIAGLENLLNQAVDKINSDNVDESMAVGSIRQYLVAFNVASHLVLDASDNEGGLGEETTRQMDTLVNHYQPSLINSLAAFEKLERDAAEKSISQIESIASQISLILFLASLIAVTFAITMSLWFARRFVIPLTALTEHVRLLPDASLDEPLQITTNDEMGALAQALNRMEVEIRESHQKLERYAATLESQVEERTRALKLLAITDPLTGIYNRGHFFSLAEQLFLEAKRLKHPFSVAIFDIDHFKNVNDRYGHIVGDYALERTTHAMQSQIRQMDVLGRYGGEEFVMAFPAAGIDEALQIGQRIVNAVRNTQLELDGHRFNVTVSGGIASGGVTIHESLESILLKADKALYMAKENGRDMVVAYQSMNANKEKT